VIRSAEIVGKRVRVGTGANQTGSNPSNLEPCLAVNPIILHVKSSFGSYVSLSKSKSDAKKEDDVFSAII
jgi:hypothetical protein